MIENDVVTTIYHEVEEEDGKMEGIEEIGF